MLHELFWIGACTRWLAAIGLFWNIWCKKTCSGISVKSQLLYALVFTTRYLDVFASYHGIETVLLYYSNLISVLVLLRKSYEKKYDAVRIETLIISCGIIAFLVNHNPSTLGIVKMFSVYLETIVMVPQFQFIFKAKHIQPHILLYISAIGIYGTTSIAHCGYEYFYGNIMYNELQVAAGTVQLLIYCDFFLRILPWTWTPRQRSTGSTIEIDIESGIPEMSHLNRNISTAALVHNSLVGVYNNKVNLSSNVMEEPNKKSEFSTSLR